MSEFSNIYELFDRRICRSISFCIVMASLIATDVNKSDAAQSLFSFRRKPSSDSAAKSNPGFTASIRKLMADAKAQEAQGYLDRAIKLADRANSLAESSMSIAKPAPDVSPTVTAKYANELRLKKADAQVGPIGGKPQREVSVVSSRQVPQVRANNSNDQPTVENRLADKPNSREAGLSPKPLVVVAASISETNLSESATECKSSNDILMVGFDSDDKPVITSMEPNPPNALPEGETASGPSKDDVWNKKRTSKKPVVSSKEIADWDANDGEPPVVTPLPSTKDRGRKPIAKSKPIRLRSRFPVDGLADVGAPAPQKKTEPTVEIHPTVAAKKVPPNRQEASIVIPEPLYELTNIRIVAAAGEHEAIAPSRLIEESGFASAKHDSDRATETASEDVSNTGFSLDNVMALKRRLETATALRPGEIRSAASQRIVADTSKSSSSIVHSNEEPLTRSDETHDEDSRSTSIESDPPPKTTISSHQMVVGRTSMIKWQPAKEKSPAIAAPLENVSKSKTIIADLRQSLREPVPPVSDRESRPADSGLFSLPSVEFGRVTKADSTDELSTTSSREIVSTRAEVHGGLWDNALVPVTEGFSGSIGASSRSTYSDSDIQGAAPLPPQEGAVEQIASESFKEISNRRRRQRWNDSTKIDIDRMTPVSSQEVSESGKSQTLRSSSTSNDHLNPSSESLSKWPIERIAKLLGMSNSTASSLFGAAGLTMLIAGLWAVRAVVRSKNS